jgi:hypothetical protein
VRSEGLSTTMALTANLQRFRGQFAESEQAHRRSLELCEGLCVSWPEDPVVQTALARQWNRLGVLVIGENVGRAWSNLAGILAQRDRGAEALAPAHRAVQLWGTLWAVNRVTGPQIRKLPQATL